MPIRTLRFLFACSIGAGVVWAQAPAQPAARGGGARYVDAVAEDFNDHNGWQSMFDGKSLAGWDGPADLWRVEDGVIVVRSKADPPTRYAPVAGRYEPRL